MTSSILITGGAGFIGSHLADELLRAGHTVTILDNFVNGKREYLDEARTSERFTLIKGDILDPETCLRAVHDADIVYHLACMGVRHSLHSPLENHRVNAEGTLKVLEASRQAGVRRFLYISSSEVYGRVATFPIKETDQTLPTTIYGASKLAGEHYTNAYHTGFCLDTTVARIFNNYGPRSHHEGDAGEIIPRAIVNALYGISPVIFGDGSHTRDFFYVGDTARALRLLLHTPDSSGETVNIGTGSEITMKELVKAILGAIGNEQLCIRYEDARPADVPRLWVDTSKFRELAGFAPEVSFTEGLQATVDYFRELKKQRNLLSDMPDRNWK